MELDLTYRIGVDANQAQSTTASVERGFGDVTVAAEKMAASVNTATKTAAAGVKSLDSSVGGLGKTQAAAGSATTSLADKLRTQGATGVEIFRQSVEGARERLMAMSGAGQAAALGLGPVGIALAVVATAAVGLGVALVAGVKTLAGWVSEALAAGDAALTLASKTGLSVEALAGYRFVGGQAGVALESITGAVFKLESTIGSGTRRSREAIGALGVSFDELRRAKPEDAFNSVIQKLGELPNASDRAAVGTALFGGKFREVSALAKEDVGAMLTDFHRLGGGVTTEMAIAADMVGDAQGRIQAAFESTRLKVGAVFLPTMAHLAQTFGDAWINMAEKSGLSMTSFAEVADKGAAFVIRSLGYVVSTIAVAGDAVQQFAAGEFIRSMGLLQFLAEVIDKVGLTGQVFAVLTQNGILGKLSEEARAAAGSLKTFSIGAADFATKGADTLHRIADGMRDFGGKLAQTSAQTLGDLRRDIAQQAAQAREEAGRTTDALVNLGGPRVKSAIENATDGLKKMASQVEAAQRAGATSRDVYDQYGTKLLAAAREADLLGINVRKVSVALNDAIDAAREFKLDEIMAKANQDMAKEFQRVLKEMNGERAKIREQEEKAQFDSNQKVLGYYQDAEDAKAQATRDRAQGTAHEAQAEADFKIYQLDRWRQQELSALNTSSSDYALLAGQIEEIYAVRLQGVMDTYAAQHQTFWQRLKQGAGDIYQGLVSTVSDGFASMLTRAQSFKDGFVGIWQSIKSTFTNILADMLDYYLKKFIAQMILGMGGGGGGVTGAILNAAGLGGGGGGVTGGVTGNLQQQGTNWLLQAMGIGGGSTIGGVTSLAGTAALAPGLASGGLGAAGAGLSSTSLAGMSGTMPALSSGGIGGASGAGLGAGLAGGAAAGGAGLGLGLLMTKLLGGSGWKASGLGAAAGAGAGALIGTFVFPGIGTALGAGIGAIGGAIGGWIGKSVGEKINDSRDEFLQQFGKPGTAAGSGFANVNADLDRMNRLGMDGELARRLIFNPKDWDDFNAGVVRLQAAFEDLRFVQDKVNESYVTLQQRGREAMDQGASEIEVLKAQSAGYSEIYNTIIRTGAEAPAGFEPVAQKLLEMGLLLDANGQKVENLHALYANNALHMVSSTQDITEAFSGLQGQQDALIAQGVQHEDVLKIQAGAYSQLVDQIKEMGGTAPEAMRPVLEELMQMGLLVGKTGAQVTDLGGVFQSTGQDGVGMGSSVQKALAKAATGAEMTEDQLRDMERAIAAANQETQRGAGFWQEYKDRGITAGPRIAEALDELRGTARDVIADVQQTFDQFQPRPVRWPLEWEMPGKPEPSLAAQGGYVTPRGVQYLADGGWVKPRGTDTVPAMLTPGEGVLSRRGMRALADLNSGRGSGGDTIVIEKGAIVVHGSDDPDAVADRVMRRLEQRMKVQKRRRAA